MFVHSPKHTKTVNANLNQSSFFEIPYVGIIDIFCLTSNGNNLEIVANEMNSNTDLDLPRAY